MKDFFIVNIEGSLNIVRVDDNDEEREFINAHPSLILGGPFETYQEESEKFDELGTK